MAKRGQREINRIDNSFGKYSPSVEARPIDTYIAPLQTGVKIDNKYADLAAGINAFYAPAAALLQAQAKEKEGRDTARGQKMYTENGDRQSWEDYKIANPNIPINESIKRGYLLARTSNEAELFKRNMLQTYNSGGALIEKDGKQINVADTDDFDSFNTWATQYMRDYIDQNMGADVDPEIFANLFMPQVDKSIGELAVYHEKRRNETYLLKSEAEHGELMRNLYMANVDENGRFTATSYAAKQELATQYSAIIENMISSGMSREKAVAIAVNQFISIAESLDIEESDVLLDIAMNVNVGDGVRLGALGTESGRLKTAVFEIENRKEARAAKEKRDQEEARKEKVEAVAGELFRANLKKPVLDTENITDRLMEAGATATEVAHYLGIMKSAYNAGRAPVDPEATARAIRRREKEQNLAFVLEYGHHPSVNTVLEAYNEGRLGIDDATKYITNNLESGGVVRQILKNNEKDIESQIKILCGLDEKLTPDGLSTVQYVFSLTASVVSEKLAKEPGRANTPHGIRLLVNDAVKEAYNRAPKSVHISKKGEVSIGDIDSDGIHGVMKHSNASYRDVPEYNKTLNLQASFDRDTKAKATLKNTLGRWIKSGKSAKDHEAVKTLIKQGYTIAQIEAALGTKLTKRKEGVK